MKQRAGVVIAGAVCLVTLACGRQGPQELPVVVSPTADDGNLQWRDPHGPLRGEVPWVLRTDLLGPDTFLVVETDSGDVCAQTVSFRVLAAGVTEYTVTLASDLRGRVSWRVTYGNGKRMKIFSCSPRPADDPRQECLKGGIPKPLFGELVGAFSAELVGGAPVQGARTLRFERGFPCESAVPDSADDGSQTNES
jgi:hypothetical protein